MSTKRKDNKGRVLRDGESQRKDGRYEYKYTDQHGVRRSIYSWRLVDTDKTPDGKRKSKSLREMISDIQRDKHDEIDTYNAKNMTVDQLFTIYMDSKCGVRDTSLSVYYQDYNSYVKEYIGEKIISTIKPSDIMKMYADLIDVKEYSINTVGMANRTTNGMFKIAVENGYLRSNPCNGVFATIKKRYENQLVKNKREAIDLIDQQTLIEHLKTTRKYEQTYRLVVFLLGTGCRIGEACGLTWDDIDFKNNLIHIRRTLSYSNVSVDDKFTKAFCLHPAKTLSGRRTIPMFSEIKELLLEEKERQVKNGGCIVTMDGVSGFVFINSKGNVLKTTEASAAIAKACKKYNKKENEIATKQGRNPVPLPIVSAHILRHTFCTRLCECGVQLEVVQKIMGHKNIAVTAEIYNRVTNSRKIEEVKRVEDRFVIANFEAQMIDVIPQITTEDQFTTDFTTNDRDET